MRPRVLVYDLHGDGHRSNYVRFLSEVLGGDSLIAPWFKSLFVLLAHPNILFSTYESNPVALTALALLRSLLWKKTSVIILRPFVTVAGPTSLIKVGVHRILAAAPNVRLIVLTNLPKTSHLFGRAQYLADPEYWDVSEKNRNLTTPLSAQARQLAAGQKILLYAGAISTSKGIDFLANLMSHPDWRSLNIFVVVAGKVSEHTSGAIKLLKSNGAYVIDRYISDEELFSLFAIASLSWCCYEPSRDMTSGIFGRSQQFGVLPIVREGSLLAEQVKDAHCGVAIPWMKVPNALQSLGIDRSGLQNSEVDSAAQVQKLTDIVYG